MAYEENVRKARWSGQTTFFAWLAAFLLVTVAVCVAFRDPLTAMLMVPRSLAVSWRFKVNAQDSRKIDATREEANALIAKNPARHSAVYHLDGPCEASEKLHQRFKGTCHGAMWVRVTNSHSAQQFLRETVPFGTKLPVV